MTGFFKNSISRRELATTAGAGLVGFTQTRAVASNVQSKLRETVSVFDFMTAAEIADVKARTASVDVTAAMQAARDWLATTLGKLVFPNGLYKYATSPNWAIHHSEVVFEGNVTLRYTGTANAVVFDASASDAVVFSAGFCYATKWGWVTRPNIEAPSTAGHGLYVKSCHHAKIGARVRGCGAASAGLRVDFAVCSEFDITVSVNEDGWYSGAKPKYGYFLSRRNAGETTSYCTFVNPIVEGPTIGIYLDRTLGNTFLGGTSEACSQYGLATSANAAQDKFYGMDFEVNTIADVHDLGTGLVIDQCDTYYKCIFGSTSKNAQLRGGRHASVLFDTGSTNCTGTDLVYNRFNDGSTMQDAGTANVMRNIRNIGTGLNYLNGSTKSTGVVGVPNGTTTVISNIAVVGSKLGEYVVAAYSVSITGFSISAFVTSDGFVRVVFSNNSGGTINLPAGTVKVAIFRP